LYLMTGSTYFATGKYPEAISHYYRALKNMEQQGRKDGMVQCHLGIGNIYITQNEPDKALKEYLAALEIAQKSGNRHSVADCHSAIGIAHLKKNDPVRALEQYELALKSREEEGDLFGMTTSYNNIAEVYSMQGRLDLALETGKKNLQLQKQLGDRRGVAITYTNIGETLYRLKDMQRAKLYLDSAVTEGKSIGVKDVLRITMKDYAAVDSAMGDWKGVYEHYRLEIAYADSLNNEENTRRLVQEQMQFEFDKKQLADSLLVVDERRMNALKFEQEKTRRYYLYAGLLLVIVFAGFMYNRFRLTQKQKQIIELKEREAQHQKDLIEEKQKEILDSIHYARRIQYTQLPTEKYITRTLEKLRPNRPPRSDSFV